MQKTMSWKGVIPALTTCFKSDLSVDYDFVARHIRWVVDNGCISVVIGGSLGEGATLTTKEKLEIISHGVRTVGQRAPIVAGVSALSTHDAVEFARAAAEHGCGG